MASFHMTSRFYSSSVFIRQTHSDFSSLISTSFSFRNFPFSNPLILSKSQLFSSISIERLPTKASSPSTSDDLAPIESIEDLPSKLQDIVKLFQSVEDPKAKYQQLLFYGRNLTPLESKFKTKENKVQGCVSQVWVRAYLDSDKNVYFEADSDSSLTKGLAALLVQGFSGQPVSEVLTVSPNFITLLGLKQSLTPSRNNGFLNMLKLMQIKALQLYKEAEESAVVDNGALEVGDEAEGSYPSDGRDGASKEEPEIVTDDLNSYTSEIEDLKVGNEAESSNLSDGKDGAYKEEPEIGTDNLNSDTSEIGKNKSDFGVGLGSRGERIKEILARELCPVELQVDDISHQHAGHAEVGRNAVETHFNVKIVSKMFEGKSLVKRHRLVYGLLQNELQTGLHALSIVAKTPSEGS